MSRERRSSGPARDGGAAGGRLTDPGWLVHGDPELILACLDGADVQEETLAAVVYRTSGHVHRDAGAGVRRQVLALDAARYGNRELARDIARVAVRQGMNDLWVVQWATGSDLDSRLRYALPVPAKVSALATVVVGSRGIAVAGCADGTLHAWDLATGSRLGKAVSARTGAVVALVTAVLDGRPVAVTAGSDRSVRVWDLARGELVGTCSADADSWVKSLAAGLVEGRPVVVGACVDDVVRVWDLATLSQHAEPLTIRTGFVSALATAVVDGRPVAVTSHSKELAATDPITGEETVRLWDLITGREFGPLGEPPEQPPVFADRASDRTVEGDSDGEGEAGRCVSLDVNTAAHFLVTDPECQCPIAVSANAYEVHVWNLATREQVGEPAAVFVETAAVTVLHDHPAALVATGHGAVGVWDLATLRPLQPSLTGHEAAVRGTATAVVNRRQLAVTGGDDRSVRIWDLDGEKGTGGGRLTGHAGSVTGLITADVDGSRVIVTGGSDTSVRIWDLDGAGQLGEPLTGHTAGVDLLAAGTVDGRLTLLTRDDRYRTVRIWDLTTRQELHGRSTSEYTSPSIDFFAVVDGSFVGVTGEGRVWDLTASRWIGVQPRRPGALALEELEGRNVILTGDRAEGVHLWDLTTGELLAPPLTGHTGEVRSGATGMLDGRPVVVAGGDRTVWTWDASTGQQIGAYEFPSRIRALTVAPDGRLVVGFGADIAVLAHRR
ncbi:WD40 repeat domain-containing protein [Streptomyces sp. P3]|uniref:WD40 repeat domain-containing protein n=1 Tax=Streptomyces sp. P3 TaxID=2135430 RepID=UPI00131F0D31|nr:WD40 repeat domain-containing protein [Streptomyces sp. P3]